MYICVYFCVHFENALQIMCKLWYQTTILMCLLTYLITSLKVLQLIVKSFDIKTLPYFTDFVTLNDEG